MSVAICSTLNLKFRFTFFGDTPSSALTGVGVAAYLR